MKFAVFALGLSLLAPFSSSFADSIINTTADKFTFPKNAAYCDLTLQVTTPPKFVETFKVDHTTDSSDGIQSIEASVPLSSLYSLSIGQILPNTFEELDAVIKNPASPAYGAVLELHYAQKKLSSTAVTILNSAGNFSFGNVEGSKIKVFGRCQPKTRK